MIKHKMISRHDPDKGQYGDCLRTCVASLLDLQLSDVPHFAHDGPDGQELWDRVRQWLQDEWQLSTWFTLYDVTDWTLVTASVNANNPDMYYLLMGCAPFGGDHVVICRGDEIVHDPAHMGAGLIGPASNGYFGVLVFVSARLVP